MAVLFSDLNKKIAHSADDVQDVQELRQLKNNDGDGINLSHFAGL